MRVMRKGEEFLLRDVVSTMTTMMRCLWWYDVPYDTVIGQGRINAGVSHSLKLLF